MFYIPSLSFLTTFSFGLLSPSPQLRSQFTGRQEGWLRTTVPLPKLIASKDERPPLIALPGLLLSKQSTPHSLRKCVLLHGHSPWQWWNYSGVCSKYSSFLVSLLCVNLVRSLLSRVCSKPFLFTLSFFCQEGSSQFFRVGRLEAC